MSFGKKTIRSVDLEGKRVLLRADYNVPLKDDGTIADDYRLRQSLPTLHYLLEQCATVVICSHLGRPDGKPDKKFSLEPIAQHLANLLKVPVHFIPASVGDKVTQSMKALRAPALVLLENLRFHPEEEANDEAFAQQLAHDSLADYFVQDGFGVVHRAHASTDAITHYLPSLAGLLLEKEVTTLTAVRDHPKRPLVAVLGGAKIADKILLVKRFIKKADKVIIGGAMANTFLKWEGHTVGKSKVEAGVDEVIADIAKLVCDDVHDHRFCLRQSGRLILPTDVAVATEFSPEAERINKSINDIAADDIILDLGEKSIETMTTALNGAKMVLWNGTLGYAEYPQFAHGSARLALWMAQHKPEVKTIIGGGDTADFVLHWDGNNGDSFTHISTGGGASLELLSGATLPGVEALLDA